MARHEAHIDIARPVADVWAFVSDIGATPRWRTTVRSVTPPERLAVGAEFEATTRVFGRTWSWRIRIAALEIERRLGYEVVDGVADLTVEYLLEAVDDGCHFTLVGESRPKNMLTRVLDRPAAWNLRRETADHLPNLKRIMEAPA